MRALTKRLPIQLCLRLLLLGNLCFAIFIFICLTYYFLFGVSRIYVFAFELLAYSTEIIGFILCLLGAFGISVRLEGHHAVKGLTLVYLITELVLMLMDFDFISLETYNGQSDTLIIGHAIFSAMVVLTYMTLEQEPGKLQISIMITAGIMLAGMFSAAFDFRVYGSILVNAIAYIYLYQRMLFLLDHEELHLRCKGDPVKPQTYKSTFFNE